MPTVIIENKYEKHSWSNETNKYRLFACVGVLVVLLLFLFELWKIIEINCDAANKMQS